jgi:hypothetical protein
MAVGIAGGLALVSIVLVLYAPCLCCCGSGISEAVLFAVASHRHEMILSSQPSPDSRSFARKASPQAAAGDRGRAHGGDTPDLSERNVEEIRNEIAAEQQRFDGDLHGADPKSDRLRCSRQLASW